MVETYTSMSKLKDSDFNQAGIAGLRLMSGYMKESYFLLFKPETASLNKRSEIFTPCPHRKLKFLDNAKLS